MLDLFMSHINADLTSGLFLLLRCLAILAPTSGKGFMAVASKMGFLRVFSFSKTDNKFLCMMFN